MAIPIVLGFAVVVRLALPRGEVGDRFLLLRNLAFQPGDLAAVSRHGLVGRCSHGLGLATS
jgi:hypothetical protein